MERVRTSWVCSRRVADWIHLVGVALEEEAEVEVEVDGRATSEN